MRVCSWREKGDELSSFLPFIGPTARLAGGGIEAALGDNSECGLADLLNFAPKMPM